MHVQTRANAQARTALDGDELCPFRACRHAEAFAKLVSVFILEHEHAGACRARVGCPAWTQGPEHELWSTGLSAL